METETPQQEDKKENHASMVENDKISEIEEKTYRHKEPRQQRPKQTYNPLQRGINEYLTKHLAEKVCSSHDFDASSLIASLPKRYDLYPPLLLLPAKALGATPQWQTFISALDDSQLQELYECIAASFSSRNVIVTHIAVNAPIARMTAAGTENEMRSPTGLIPLYGDFGPVPRSAEAEHGPQQRKLQYFPNEDDFRAALWVRAVQNAGIVQIWAPLYTMFSRGNVVEKARILGLGKGRFDGLDESELKQPVSHIAAVDMYAGIGYFVFSYLKRGVGRVWAWELNPWSIEGLRRGCEENGWKVLVVRVDSEGKIETGLRGLVDELDETHRVVAFLGDNKFAAEVMGQLKIELEKKEAWKPVRHVNLGLLPTSRQSWDGAVRVLDPKSPGWVHVHENTDITNIDAIMHSVANEFESVLCTARHIPQKGVANSLATCVHVEKVKTFAPGVMHCVFDLHISPARYLDSGG